MAQEKRYRMMGLPLLDGSILVMAVLLAAGVGFVFGRWG
jgi:hypothetical protein